MPLKRPDLREVRQDTRTLPNKLRGAGGRWAKPVTALVKRDCPSGDPAAQALHRAAPEHHANRRVLNREPPPLSCRSKHNKHMRST